MGKRAGKASTFPEYAKVAFQSLGEKIDVEDSELEKWLKIKEEQHGKKLAAFHQFRALFAPLVENVILLDRFSAPMLFCTKNIPCAQAVLPEGTRGAYRLLNCPAFYSGSLTKGLCSSGFKDSTSNTVIGL